MGTTILDVLLASQLNAIFNTLLGPRAWFNVVVVFVLYRPT